MCVNAIVRMRPKRADRRGARNCEQPPSTPAAKKTAPVMPADRSKRRCSQSTSSDVTTNPPPAESRLKSADNSNTIRRELPRPPRGALGALGVEFIDADSRRFDGRRR